jgi:hypothetical protein
MVYMLPWPITVPERSKACTAFARSNAGIMGSNHTQGMDVCVHLFCACVVPCVGSSLSTGWSPVQEVLPTLYSIAKLKKRPESNKGLYYHWWMMKKVYCYARKSSPQVPNPRQMCLVHSPPPLYLISILIVFFHRFLSFFPWGLATNIFLAFLISPMCDTCLSLNVLYCYYKVYRKRATYCQQIDTIHTAIVHFSIF